MKKYVLHAVAGLGVLAGMAAVPAHAQLVSADDPIKIKAIVESQGWPAKLVGEPGDDPYIESSRNGMQFLIIFMNCTAGKQCKTLQYYMGFTGAADVPLDRFNAWNREKRFARAYLDEKGDPVLEMDVDLDFAGIPRRNVGETFKTWASLMDSFQTFISE